MAKPNLLSDIKNPGKEYRGKPFWSWNGKLDPEELKRQIKILSEMGTGGFFMHARTGLETEYLSKDWFDQINLSIEEAKTNDMEAWLYDEDRWPSGFAGGLATKKHENRLGYLYFQELKDLKKFKWSSKVVALFTCEKKKGVYTNITQLSKNDATSKKDTTGVYLHFFYEKEAGRASFNGETYLDTMSESAVGDFIKITHEAYKKNCGKDFAKTIPGIFTDEPNFGFFNYGLEGQQNEFGPLHAKLCWTPKLPAIFKSNFGYKIEAHLPEIFLKTEAPRILQSRWHYFETITSMFIKAYGKQIGEWCAKNNLLHTGHLLEEPTLYRQTHKVGNCMRFYEHMQAPGMDILTEDNREYDTAKQVSSVARQFGLKWRITETYGCTGWDFNFNGHKAIGDWQAALGINLRCQHLSWYTMEVQAKRDYPASIFYQSPWWQNYKKVEDYFARVHLAMTQGEEVRDILFIHPIESMWAIYQGPRDDVTRYIDKHFREATDYLLRNHLDFDYGDEDLMSTYAKTSKTKDGVILKLNKASYRAIVVPPMYTIRKSTLKVLNEFKKAGGTVIFMGPASENVDCLPSNEASDIAKDCINLPLDYDKQYKEFEGFRKVSILDEKNKEASAVLYLLREDQQNQYLFVANTSQKIQGDDFDRVSDRKIAYPNITIKAFENCIGKPIEVDLNSGELINTKSIFKNNIWNIDTSLDRIGSRLFIAPKKKKDQISAGKFIETKTKKTEVVKQKSCAYQLSEDNVLVLDKASATIGEGKKPTKLNNSDILDIDHAIHNHLGIAKRAGGMVQPWAAKKPITLKSIPVDLTYKFTIDSLPGASLKLAIENPQEYQITLNGHVIPSYEEIGWWVDRSLRLLQVDNSFLKKGDNELKLSLVYKEGFSGLESVYILGQFGVKLKNNYPVMIDLPSNLRIGDWTNQGLTFYSGHVNYLFDLKVKKNKGEKIFLKIPEYKGTAVRISVDGKDAGIIAWAPNEIEITDFVNNGSNQVGVQILGHRRNSHGPFHAGQKWFHWTGPNEFAHKNDDYQLVPCGLLKNIELVYKK